MKRINLITILLAIPTLFCSRVWYHAAFYREFLGHVTVAGVAVHSDSITGGRLANLIFGNAALQMFTFFLAQPVVIDRSLRWLADNIKFEGQLVNNIGQGERLSVSSEAIPFGMV